uniref:Flagellar motor switch protein FliN n=1 Tax=Desulfobacca acetoxidans TaxID=60893 RepID=A0A7C5ENG5_9BACT
MVKEGGTSQVVDFDWEKPLEEESPAPEAPETQPPSGPAPASASPKKKGELPNIELLLDIPLEITAELGRTRMIINDLLQLGQGSVIELNKLAGEPLEILVNQKLIARGEVVVVNEKFGIRLTDIISPVERIKQLG